MSRFLQVFLVLFSGTLLAAGIPNEVFKLGCPLAGLFALAPLYIAVHRSKSYKEAFSLCWLHGGFTHLLSSFWLKNFHGMAAFTLGASLVGTAFIEGFIGWILYYPFSEKCPAKKEHASSTAFNIFYFAAAYIVYEWCKSTGFLAYPWGTLSMTAIRWPLVIQIADITTQYGVSFLFALFSALFAQGLILMKKQKSVDTREEVFSYIIAARAVFIIVAAVLAYGIFQYTRPRTAIKKMNTVMVQQNMDTYRAVETNAIELSQELTQKGLNELREKGLSPDLVVWSEGVLNRRFPESQHYYEMNPEPRPLMRFIREQRIPFIIGGSLTIDAEKHKNGNAALLISKDGHYIGSYIKIHLVPFAEAIPFVDHEAVRNLVKKVAGFTYGWTQGRKYTVFKIPASTPETDINGTQIISADSSPYQNQNTKKTSVIVGAPICFDDAYNSVLRGLYKSGSELFMNITNDSWSKTESAEYQHYAVALYRAIEFRTTLARCTNSGYTVVIDPAGRTIASLPLFEEGEIAVSIPIYERKATTAAMHGEWFAYLVMAFAAFFIIRSAACGKRTGAEKVSSRKFANFYD